MRWSRRQFTRRCSVFGLAAVTVGFPMLVRGQAKGRVVVIGGGPGGATCARYLAKQSGEALAVTLIEQQARYTTCFYSNLYLAGWRDFASLVHDYNGLASLGVRKVQARAMHIDPVAKSVGLETGEQSRTTSSWSRPASTSSTARLKAMARTPRR